MKVTLVGAGMIPIPPPGYGAVEKHIWNLKQALEARGHEVRVVNRVFGSASSDEYRFALWARKEIKREPYDVLHVHTPGVANVFLAAGPRRFVYTTHSRHWAGAEGLGEKIGFRLERNAVARASQVIAVSRFVAQQIESRRAHVIPNGVDVETYAPDFDARQGNRIVGLGEIAPHKRWHQAAMAVRDLSVELRLVGPIRDPVYADQVEALGGGRVSILGALSEEELARELAQADVMVHPSVSESFGMAVVEGMSAGLPVVCSDFLSFLVRHEQEGLLVPTRGSDEERAAAISDSVRTLLSHPQRRQTMAEVARRRAVEHYSWPSVAERVETVYVEASR